MLWGRFHLIRFINPFREIPWDSEKIDYEIIDPMIECPHSGLYPIKTVINPRWFIPEDRLNTDVIHINTVDFDYIEDEDFIPVINLSFTEDEIIRALSHQTKKHKSKQKDKTINRIVTDKLPLYAKVWDMRRDKTFSQIAKELK